MIPVYRLLGLSGLLAASAASAQLSFTAHQELLPFATHSGNCMAATESASATEKRASDGKAA
jgi:hypothetical protein